MPWQLTCIGGDAVPHRIVVEGEIDVGRDPYCDLRLLDDRASRYHARFAADGRGLVVRDNRSSNGTFVGEQRVDGEVRLADGDVVRCGGVAFLASDLTRAAHATRVVTDDGAALDLAAERAPSAWRRGDDPARLPALHACQQALAAAAPAHRGRALAAAAGEALACGLAAVVTGGRVQAVGMSERLARRLAGGDQARLLTIGRELVGRTVAAEAVGSAATAPLGAAGHLVVARGLDDEALLPADLEVLAAIAGDVADHFAAPAGDVDLPEIVGTSPAITRLRERVRRVAVADATVLVTGESGTGKELVARALHRLSGRSDGPFVAVNCAAISESLFEAELFGHERGAFTGAEQARPGRFAEADGGTLFLDEVGELPERLQAKLLRVLQEGVVEAVGGRPRRIDVRVVAATNRDLAADVAAGRFRTDLYYRLDVIRIHTPPLRERRDDIPQLATHLLARAASESGLATPRLAPAAREFLSAQDWPGNVRQLANVLTRGAVMAGDEVAIEHLEFRPEAAAPASGADPDEPFPTLAEMEAAHVRRALERTGGNRSAAARLLGVSRPTILKKIVDYGLEG